MRESKTIIYEKVGNVEHVNRSFKLAFAWPKGIFWFADEYGANNIVDMLRAKEEKAPE